MTELEGPRPRASRGLKWLVVILIVGFLAFGGAFGVLLLRYRQITSAQTTSDIVQANKLAADIGRTIALPSEQASLATVVDKNKLGDPQLVRDAQNGDQLLVFSGARRVILYRPSTKKVIDMYHIAQKQTLPATQTPAGQNK